MLQVREYTGKRLLREAMKRIAGVELPINVAQVRPFAGVAASLCGAVQGHAASCSSRLMELYEVHGPRHWDTQASHSMQNMLSMYVSGALFSSASPR